MRCWRRTASSPPTACGAPRGKINELSRVVYSPCNLCKKDPTRPPLWQITAYSGVQDLEHKRDEYYDAELEMFGCPWPGSRTSRRPIRR